MFKKAVHANIRLLALLLVMTVVLSVFPTANASATSTYSEDKVRSIIDNYYSIISAKGIPHWNANHGETTLKTNANNADYAKDITYKECPGTSVKGGTCY